jgi:hypothetical protein
MSAGGDMTPEAQIMVQATQYIMHGMINIYALLTMAMGLVSAGVLVDKVEQMYYDIKYKSTKVERITTILQTAVAVTGVVIAVVILFF